VSGEWVTLVHKNCINLHLWFHHGSNGVGSNLIDNNSIIIHLWFQYVSINLFLRSLLHLRWVIALGLRSVFISLILLLVVVDRVHSSFNRITTSLVILIHNNFVWSWLLEVVLELTLLLGLIYMLLTWYRLCLLLTHVIMSARPTIIIFFIIEVLILARSLFKIRWIWFIHTLIHLLLRSLLEVFLVVVDHLGLTHDLIMWNSHIWNKARVDLLI